MEKPEIEKLISNINKFQNNSYESFYKSKEEILFYVYAANPKIYSNQSLLKVVKDLRAGSLAGVVGSALVLGLILYLFSLGDGFVLNNLDPGWNLPNRVQP